ncbi:hypothetical protein KNP414_06237 [Paenibacillus mucilaginosus KNP414]|uniref:Uncharacterized protein n=1 Tax=Paenibacillus mucilaginosus (strain KNP414) TaxID=1036673 RepID=F8FK78_PAEMK|nr:hypothetical protein KNP414_06237 [Paenibacillus mucilaginosus KNP414]
MRRSTTEGSGRDFPGAAFSYGGGVFPGFPSGCRMPSRCG